MTKNILTTIFLLFLMNSAKGQESILKPNFVQYPMDSVTKASFNKSLESLFMDMNNGQINEALLTTNRLELTRSQLQELVNYELKKDSVTAIEQDKQLVNLYPISDDKYFFSIAYINNSYSPNPILFYKIELIATQKDEGFTFSVPIDYLTRYWKTETIGNITYHYRGEINKERAKIFDEKNTLIAKKMDVEPEKFDFYMSSNFQEISKLLGFDYSLFSNGKFRDGYGVDANTIFAIMDNEDFSHDIFHYYSGKINERANRNWITEEGIAYAWGNGYYTDSNGEMISHDKLVEELKIYLAKNPKTSPLQLFDNNTKIFNHIAPEISVRSTLSGVIATEVEKKKGKEGILALINAGSQDRMESFFKATDQLIGINRDNFNSEMETLITNYQ